MPRKPSKLVILARRPELASIEMLASAGRRLRLETTVCNPDELVIEKPADGASVCLVDASGAQLEPPALVLPRMGSISDEYSLCIMQAFHSAGFALVNEVGSLVRVRNKVNALVELASAGFPVLPFALARIPTDVPRLAKQLGGFPVMVKFIRGSQGLGVMKAGDAATAASIVTAFNALGFDVYLEKFCRPGSSSDARVLLVKGKHIAAIQRQPRRRDYHANVHAGAKAKLYEPTGEELALAEKAADFFGLGLCAVDFIKTRDGVFILEVNASPGLTGVSEACGKDVAELVLRKLLGLRSRA